MWLGALVPPLSSDPGIPEARPIGRAALRLAEDGIDVVFGYEARQGRMSGLRAQPGRWEPVHDVAVAAVYDRFPSRSRPGAYAAATRGLEGVLRGNPPELVELCADKLATQDLLVQAGIHMPPVERHASAFVYRLASWGAAFLKPRYGAFGRGVSYVEPGSALPAELEGAVEGELEPALLQRAVLAPAGFAGVACRVLCQREPSGAWWIGPPVMRRSASDPVVNAARGAEVGPLDPTLPGGGRGLSEVAHQVARTLDRQPGGDRLLEIGVDVVIAASGTPWVIEVNSRPRGRLEVLARQAPRRFGDLHVEACARPFRRLAALAAC